MALCKYPHLRKGAFSLALTALISLTVQLGPSRGLAADAPIADGQNRAAQAQAIGLSLAIAARQVPLPAGATLPRSTPARAQGPLAGFLAGPLHDSGFPQVFDLAFRSGDQLGRATGAAARRPQAVNLPTAKAILPAAVAPRKASAGRNIVSDTLLFALIFKDGQDAWNARELASMMMADKEGALQVDGGAPCAGEVGCGLATAPIPGALWLLTALLIGLIGVGSRRPNRPI